MVSTSACKNTSNSFNDKTFLQASQLCNSSMAVTDTLKAFMIRCLGDVCWEVEGLRSTMVEWTVEQGYGQDNTEKNKLKIKSIKMPRKTRFSGQGARWARHSPTTRTVNV